MVQSKKTIVALGLLLAFGSACSTTEQSKEPTQSPTPQGVSEGTQSTGAGNTTGVSGSTPDNNASMGGGTDSPANENVGAESVTVMDGGKSPQASPTPAPKKKKR